MDFQFAMAIMNGYTDIAIDTPVKLRDPIIKYVLQLFDKKPVKIFQVGAIESLQTMFRVGSGWSDTIFGAYIKEFGGSLTIADIDLDHLANSHLIGGAMGYKVTLQLGDAIESISNDYDIYYLDGAEDPDQTLEQFKKIEQTKSIVLIDDIQSKAVSLTEYLNFKNIEFKIHDVGNGGMMTIDMRTKNEDDLNNKGDING